MYQYWNYEKSDFLDVLLMIELFQVIYDVKSVDELKKIQQATDL